MHISIEAWMQRVIDGQRSAPDMLARARRRRERHERQIETDETHMHTRTHTHRHTETHTHARTRAHKRARTCAHKHALSHTESLAWTLTPLRRCFCTSASLPFRAASLNARSDCHRGCAAVSDACGGRQAAASLRWQAARANSACAGAHECACVWMEGWMYVHVWVCRVRLCACVSVYIWLQRPPRAELTMVTHVCVHARTHARMSALACTRAWLYAWRALPMRSVCLRLDACMRESRAPSLGRAHHLGQGRLATR